MLQHVRRLLHAVIERGRSEAAPASGDLAAAARAALKAIEGPTTGVQMNLPDGTTYYTCIHCRDQVHVRGNFLASRERRPEMILDSDCSGQPVPGHTAPRWGTHEVSAADRLAIKLEAEHRWHLQVGQ